MQAVPRAHMTVINEVSAVRIVCLTLAGWATDWEEGNVKTRTESL